MEDNKNLVEVKNLEVSFFTYAGEVKAVRGISYNLKPGEVMGIVGESGSGKSVSSYGLMGIIPEPGKVIGGQILFEGRDVTAMSEKELLKIRGKDISMIFQDPMTSLNPLFTIGNQIEESLRKHTSLDKDQRQKRMVELLTLVGINQPEKRLKQYPHEFSGGMRQRVMIAMALACDPELVIADEPTTALDVTTQAQIIDLFKELQKKLNTTIIFISHDLGVIGEISDNIAVLYAGYVMEECDTKTLFRNPLHPYTFGLMSSRMGRSLKNKGKLYSIPGMVPSAENMPAGCPFAPRCLKAGGQCACEIPPLVEVEPGHKVRCWEVTNHVEATD